MQHQSSQFPGASQQPSQQHPAQGYPQPGQPQVYPTQFSQPQPQQYLPQQYPPQQYPPQQLPPQHQYPPQQYPPQQYQQQAYPPQQYPPQQYQQSEQSQQSYPPPPQIPPYPQQVQPQIPLPGAVGDGIADDTDAVQAAFTKSPPGSQLVFPPGTYRIVKPLVLEKPLTITGDCTFVCDFPSAPWNGQARCDNGDTWKQHLLVIRAEGVSISTIRFANNTNIEGVAGLLVEGGNFTFTKCIVSDFCQGLMIGKLKSQYTPPVTYRNIRIINNQFTNIRGVPGGSIAYGDGILFFGCEDVIIDGNSLSAAQGRTPRNGINSGPEGFTVSHTVKVTNNKVIGDWDYPITTEGGKQCEVANNIVEGCSIVGIIERGEDISVHDNVIKIIGRKDHGCTCGIQFYGVDNGRIEKNMITGSAKHGIACMPSHETKGSNNITVKDNSIEGDFFYGVYVGSSSGTFVDHNRLILTHKENSSVGVVGWYTSGLTCKDNDIQATNGTGCIFTGSKQVSMCENILANSRAGLYVAKECNDVTVHGNNFQGCKESKHGASSDVCSLSLERNIE